MKRKKFSEEQIIKILKESESGASTTDLCRRYGMCSQSFYKWKSKYGGMDISDAKKLKSIEEENRQLKRLVADQALNIQALKAVLEKKW